MHSPILHIKDGNFFEVPHFMWRYHSLDQIPQWLTSKHPDATLEQYQGALDGKILIPQPFGTPKNLYERESGFVITRFMVLEIFVAIVLTLLFVRLGRRMKSGIVPRGKAWNMFEAILVYIREQIAFPAIGHHDADRFLPLLWTMFFFILGLNLLGLVPWAGSATGAFSVTLALAAVTFLAVVIAGMFKFGPIGFWLNQVPHMDLKWYMLIVLWPFIFVIEIFGLLIRHAILAVRLLANMVAGHLVLLGIMGLAFTIEAVRANPSGSWWLTAAISILGSTLFCCLELFVALLQAYIFTFLSALFIGSAVHSH